MTQPTITAYPLTWPLGYNRTPWDWRGEWPGKSNASTWSFAHIRDELIREVESSGGGSIVLSTNIELRRDGLPYARHKRPDDPGVAIYFTIRGEQRVMCCDAYDFVEDNMRALSLSIRDLRRIAGRGTSDFLDRAFAGFKALPEQGTDWPWWETLGTRQDADEETIRQAYRRRAMETHPDRGGSKEAFQQVQEALHQGLAATTR